MRSEVIVPLVAYLALLFLLSLYAFRQRAQGNFLQEYFLGNRSMGGFVLAMTIIATYISAGSFIGGPGAGYKYALGWVLLLAAWRPPKMIIWLNLLAFGGMEAVFLWPLVLGLYWERANAAGALSSMITGGASYAALAGFHLQPVGFHPIVLALALSLLAFLSGNRFGRPRRHRRLTVITRTAMPWIQLKITSSGQQADTLSDALTESGAVSVTFQDTHDVPVYEPLAGETRLWGDTMSSAATDMATVVDGLKAHPLLDADLTYKIEQLEDKD